MLIITCFTASKQGLGTDEGRLIEILCSKTNGEIQSIKEEYQKCKFEMYFTNTHTVYMYLYRNRKAHTCTMSLNTLIHIQGVKTKTNWYKLLYGFPVYNRSLEDDVRKDTSGHFQHILISLLQANRSEEQEMDDAKVQKDAKDLYEVLHWVILTKYRV